MSLILSGTDGLSDVDGTAATPAIRGTDANTGIFFPAADTIAFSEGGAECARFDSSGNFGLGVTPSASSFTTMQIQNASLSGRASDTSVMFLTANASFDGANFKYISTNLACQYRQQAGEHYWYTAPSGTAGNTISFTQAMALNASGGLQTLNTIGVGNATPSTSGAGITFPATQSASSNANTLDDYEEGTWTPSLGGTAVYDIRTGTYTKIGNVVTITGSIRPSFLGTGSVNTITGLPFSVAGGSFSYGGIAYGDGWGASVYSAYLYLDGTTLITYGFTGAATNPSVISLFQTNARIYFSATYLTT
jgi:hypothetical protein